MRRIRRVPGTSVDRAPAFRWTRAALVVTMLVVGSVFVAAPPASASYVAGCFGHNRTFRDGSHVLEVDWDRDYRIDSCFGIAPNRTVWNTWRAATGWAELPNGGRADEICYAYRQAVTDFPTLNVGVDRGSYYDVYSSSYNTNTRRWQKWVHDPNGWCYIW
jgi:hypothetical protein